MDARERNLLIKITKWAIDEVNDEVEALEKIEKCFTEDDKVKKIFFKKLDIVQYSNIIFNGDGFIKDKKKELLKGYIRNYYKYKNTDESELEKKYKSLTNEFNNYNSENISIMLKEAAVIAEKVHWKYMPIYKEEYIGNSDMIPEDDLKKYYNHYHMIEDLYRYIYTNNKVNWKSTEGDINLEKKMTFKIYTCRWGHYDYYSIKRTMNGWKLYGFPAGSGECSINGEGALLQALKHDSVFYPEEGLKYAMEVLWREADTTEMKLEIIEKKLEDISEWLKAVEIATHEEQPEWSQYY